MIFGQSNNSLHNQVENQNCGNLQTYFKLFGVAFTNKASIGTLQNISFK